jgi:hypothetical protein
MKVSDIVEAYGLNDEPGQGVSKATVRQQQSGDPANQNKRANNDNKNANDEANIAAAHQFHSQKRKQYAPTGIPNRAYMQQQQELQNQGKQQ